jgi:hypothetical protein
MSRKEEAHKSSPQLSALALFWLGFASSLFFKDGLDSLDDTAIYGLALVGAC